MPQSPHLSAPTAGVLNALRDVVGPKGVIEGDHDRAPFLTEWRDRYRGRTPLIVAPATTEEVSKIVRICAGHTIAITPQGGNTGLVGGQIPFEHEILLTLKRMNKIRAVDGPGMTITADAGVTVAAVQEAADEADRFFSVSLGSEGTCQLGGVISTNAGGVNVVRYGNTREQVLGLEAVLPDGRIWNGLRALRKDNTGYDLKQLFIGAEGTLGVVTAATVRLYPKLSDTVVVFAGIDAPEAAVALLARAQGASGGLLSSFEFLPRIGLEMVLKHSPGARDPLSQAHPWYVLAEFSGGAAQGLRAMAEAFLAEALEEGLVRDAALAESVAQAQAFWKLRHDFTEAMKHEGGGIKHDVSVPIASIPAFLKEADAAVEGAAPGGRIVAFGHLGDGNVHYDICPPADGDAAAFTALAPAINTRVHDIVATFGGSISAEHGLGQLKRDEILRYKSETEMDMMRAVKAALDPKGIMNPGKVL